MNWKVFASAFGSIFIAELGDKTQLTTVSLAAGNSSGRWTIFLGASLALVATTAVNVLLGEGIAHYVPMVWINRAAGIVFIVLGTVYLWRS